ncbi:hypothetical protein L7F22_059203 [Adiantum nelumboides]|nr:hypothetical protein [Adiantum nelumboides]
MFLLRRERTMKPDCPQRQKKKESAPPSSNSIPDVQGNTDQEKGKRQLLKGWGSLNNQRVLILYDPGSTDNFISLDTANRLNLSTNKLGTPVTSGSAFEGLTTNCTPVHEKLNLQIGMYKDHESFLMAPIEGCDVILGMPWHYRIHPIPDFVEKTLTLPIEDKKIIVYADAGDWPFPLVSHISVKKEIKNCVSAYLIFAKEKDMSKESMSLSNEDNERTEFLEKYNDCFTESLPDRLPPERPEDHKIDLIPGSSPPNQPPYHSYPERGTRREREGPERVWNGKGPEGGPELRVVAALHEFLFVTCRTVVNIDMKLDLVPPWLINFISRQLTGLGFKLFQKTLISINKGEGSSKHFQTLLETEPMYKRIRKGLQVRKTESSDEEIVMGLEIPQKRPSNTSSIEASKVLKSMNVNEKVESSGSTSLCNTEEIVPVLAEEEGSSVTNATGLPSSEDGVSVDPEVQKEGSSVTNATGLPSSEDGVSVDPEVQKALNALDQMIALVQSRRVQSSKDNVSMPLKSATLHSKSTQLVNTNCSETNQNEQLSMVVPLQQIVNRKELAPSLQTSQIEAKHKWFCIPSHFCCG